MSSSPNTPAPTEERGSVVRRGAIAGLVGAAVVAVWFFVIDGLSGELLHTPAFLARVLLGAEGMELLGAQVAVYTVLHVASFLAIGVATAWVLDRLPVAPGLLIGVALGFLLFDLIFYFGVTVTGTNVVGYLGWPEVLVANILAGVSVVGTIRRLGHPEGEDWATALSQHRVLREGIVVGLIGAAAVAVWFLLIDIVAGRVLFTPAALGSVVFHGATGADQVQTDALTILGYTGLHVAAFFVTGLIAAAIVAAAEDRHPYILLGAALLFVTFETFFIGLMTIVAQWLLQVIPWWSIAVGNLVAAAAMGYYLWTRHPRLAEALGQEELERSVGQVEPPVRR